MGNSQSRERRCPTDPTGQRQSNLPRSNQTPNEQCNTARQPFYIGAQPSPFQPYVSEQQESYVNSQSQNRRMQFSPQSNTQFDSTTYNSQFRQQPGVSLQRPFGLERRIDQISVAQQPYPFQTVQSLPELHTDSSRPLYSSSPHYDQQPQQQNSSQADQQRAESSAAPLQYHYDSSYFSTYSPHYNQQQGSIYQPNSVENGQQRSESPTVPGQYLYSSAYQSPYPLGYSQQQDIICPPKSTDDNQQRPEFSPFPVQQQDNFLHPSAQPSSLPTGTLRYAPYTGLLREQVLPRIEQIDQVLTPNGRSAIQELSPQRAAHGILISNSEDERQRNAEEESEEQKQNPIRKKKKDKHVRFLAYVERKQIIPFKNPENQPSTSSVFQGRTFQRPVYLSPILPRILTFTEYDRRPGGPDQPQEHREQSFENEKVRKTFVRKVYTILMLQLLFMLGVIALFVFEPHVKNFVQENMYSAWVALAIFLPLFVALACFPKVWRVFPENVIVLCILTLSASYMLGTLSSFFETDVIFMAVGICAGICLVVSIFSLFSDIDFSNVIQIICILLLVLIPVGIVALFLPSKIIMMIYATLGAVIFTGLLAFDTQRMLRGKLKFSPDDYVSAALHIYFDIIHLFLTIILLLKFRK